MTSGGGAKSAEGTDSARRQRELWGLATRRGAPWLAAALLLSTAAGPTATGSGVATNAESATTTGIGSPPLTTSTDVPATSTPNLATSAPTATVPPETVPPETKVPVTQPTEAPADVSRGVPLAALDAFFAQRVGPLFGADYQHVVPLAGVRSAWFFQDAFIDRARDHHHQHQHQHQHHDHLVDDLDHSASLIGF